MPPFEQPWRARLINSQPPSFLANTSLQAVPGNVLLTALKLQPATINFISIPYNYSDDQTNEIL